MNRAEYTKDLILKFPTYLIWHILKEDLSYSELRVLFAVVAYFNDVKLFVYDYNIKDIKERVAKRKLLIGKVYNYNKFKKFCTSYNLTKKDKLESVLKSLAKKNFINNASFNNETYIYLKDRGPSFRLIPSKTIDECNTKNVLALKLILWMHAIQKQSIKDGEGNFIFAISVDELISKYLCNMKKKHKGLLSRTLKGSDRVHIKEINRRIRDAANIVKESKFLTEFIFYGRTGLRFTWSCQIKNQRYKCNLGVASLSLSGK